METKLIKGLNQVQSKYDAFFIDLWGVIHNGIKLYPGAIEVLENLNKLNKIFLKNIFTSGEAALQSLQKNIYGKNFYHLGPERDVSLFEGFENNRKNLEDADFILCTGFLDSHKDSLDYYKDLLKQYTQLKMVCTNPDLVVHRGSKTEYCAGSVAVTFEKLGGKVIYFGKPYPEIYNFCIKKNETTLAIGDNIRTDIRGANKMKLDSLLIIDGIHKKEFLNLAAENYDEVLKKYKTKTNYYQERLSW